MSDFMNRYFSIAFLFVVAAAFVACNYEGQAPVEPVTEVEELLQAGDSTINLPFELDSIKTVSQLLDSLEAVQVD
jgi:hypothetical protein